MIKKKTSKIEQKPMPTIDAATLKILKKKKKFKSWYLLVIFLLILLVSIIYYRSYFDWLIIKDYLAIIVSWPPVILILGLLFMTRFRSSIEAFLGKLNHMKAAGIEISQQQTATTQAQASEDLNKEVAELEKNNDESVTLTKEQIQEIIVGVEQLEFKYLDLHLVPNTKSALRLMSEIEVQRSAFLQIYQVPAATVNLEAERYAILEALTSNGLAVDDRGVMKITEKGARFLKYEGVV